MQKVKLRSGEPVQITYTKRDGSTGLDYWWFDEGNGRLDYYRPVPQTEPKKSEAK